jgi:uncharacterized phage protein gp47/JayE
MPSQSDVSSSIIAALAASEPDLDTTIGSVTRKIIDAVASAISDVSLDNQLLTYQYDINSMTGSNLDSFVQLFGMTRYPAARAVGQVTFTRPTATDVISIPINAQVASTDGTVTVQTVTAAVLGVGDLSVSVPVQAVVAGPAGNVSAGTLTQLQTAVSEITTVTNVSALTGGANQETDIQLQNRWKTTVFKSMAGTSQMFLGLALNDPDCTAANVIGAASRWTEQLQIVSGAATSTIPDAQYVYPSGQLVGQDIDAGEVAAPGTQYTWNYGTIPPSISVIDSSYFPNGEVVDVSFLYLDQYSRNVETSGIFNRVDVWCAGTRAVNAAQTLAFSNAITFSSSPASQYYTGNFVRADGTTPTAGNIFVPLAWGPILTVDGTLTVGATTYGLATAADPLGTTAGGVSYAYQIVHQTGAFGWSTYSLFGLEWVLSMAPSNGSSVTISEDYTYNDVIYSIQQNLENWRLAGTDVQAHQGLVVDLQFSLAVVYDPSITVSVTQTAIQTAISNYLSQLGFDSRLYPSSIISVVENTPGVIASRFLVGSDYAGYNGATPNAYNVGIQQLVNGAVVSSYVDTSGNPVDIEFGAAQLPAFGATQLVTKAGNSFGSFA